MLFSFKRVMKIAIQALVSLTVLFPVIHGWGLDGHFTICKIAQSRLNKAATEAMNQLLPDYAINDLASLCLWADHIKFRYHWSRPLHYINTPDDLCTYEFTRDCKNEYGVKDMCVAGAINNYTDQLLTYKASSSQGEYNLTEALLFLSHFIGDVHQPLHVGFTSDKGANTIDVHWYTRKTVLHHVWDTNIIETAEEKLYNTSVDDLIDAINEGIQVDWAKEVPQWEKCNSTTVPCPDIYAYESINFACQYAYKGVSEGSILEDDYFKSSWSIVELRLAQGGVRLAATLNRIFG